MPKSKALKTGLNNLDRRSTRKHYVKPGVRKYGTVENLTNGRTGPVSDGGSTHGRP